MADVDQAVEYVLRQEDSRLSGVITKDSGGRTRFGVAEKFHPELTSTGFYDTMPVAQALEVAVSVYKSQYANNLHLDKINSQIVANAFLSYAVNIGIATSIKLLQRLLGLIEDGVIGSKTLTGINTTNPTYLLTAWRTLMIGYYRQVAEDKPSEAVYLNGWLNRVDENSKQV